jgi:uncharacterized membrane protein
MATHADDRTEHRAAIDRGASGDHLTRTPERNVGRRERVASVALGGALLVRGLRRRSPGGAATALAGGLLVARGVTGSSRLYRALGANTTAATTIEQSITVGRPADDLAEYWRDPEHLTRILGRVAEVEAVGDDRHRWTVHGPLEWSVSWETRIVEDRPGEVLRWASGPDAPVPNEWTVRFRPAPTDRGTQVTLAIRVDPPAGALGDAAMKRLGFVPRTITGEALDRFKSLAETGEIPTLERNPSARGRGDLV